MSERKQVEVFADSQAAVGSSQQSEAFFPFVTLSEKRPLDQMETHLHSAQTQKTSPTRGRAVVLKIMMDLSPTARI